MDKRWSQFRHWGKHEASLVQPWMRQRERRCPAHFVIEEQEVEVDYAWLVSGPSGGLASGHALAAHGALDRQQTAHQRLRGKLGLDFQHAVEKWSLEIGVADRFGFVDGGLADHATL